MKTSSATPRSRATNVSSGSAEPASAAARHDLRQSSNCAGDASATVATRFLTGLKAIQVQFEQYEPRKVAENRDIDKFKARPMSDWHPSKSFEFIAQFVFIRGFRMKQFATITVIGRDKTGVIARVTNFLFEQHANIEALEEQVTRGQFSMTLQASWKRGDLKTDSLRAGWTRWPSARHGNQTAPDRPEPPPAFRHHGHEGNALFRRAAGSEIEGRSCTGHRQLRRLRAARQKITSCRSRT